MMQYRVFLTGSRRGAIATGKLVRHYGGKVVAFNGEEVELPNYIARSKTLRDSKPHTRAFYTYN